MDQRLQPMGNGKPPREGFVSEEPQAAAPAPAPEPEILPGNEIAAAAEEVREVAETWPVKVKLLKKPIRSTKGGMISELSFREPTAGDINRYGCPVRFNMAGDMVFDEHKMTTMMAALSGVLQPFIETMDPRDWQTSAYRLARFFLPDTAAS